LLIVRPDLVSIQVVADLEREVLLSHFPVTVVKGKKVIDELVRDAVVTGITPVS